MKNNPSATAKGPSGIDREDLLNSLSKHDVRSVLEAYGFDFSTATEKEKEDWRWRSVLGPSVLGEGENPDFCVRADGRSIKDWGSSNFSGSVLDVVMDVDGVDLPEALRTVADLVGYTPRTNTSTSTSDRYSLNGHADFDAGDSTPRPTRPPAAPSPPAPPGGDVQEAADGAAGREAVTDVDTVWTCNEQLFGSEKPVPRSARRYLMDVRGFTKTVLRATAVGIAHQKQIRAAFPSLERMAYLSDLWITVPIPPLGGSPDDDPVAVKCVGFDADACDWTRGKDGKKIMGNAGSAALLDLSFDAGEPLLVCEGETDLLAAVSADLPAVAGTGGAGTWKDRWSRYLADLDLVRDHGAVVCYDGDEAGRKGSQRVADSLRAAGIDVRVADLPDGADVNDVLVDGGCEALQAVLDEAVDYAPPEPDPSSDGAVGDPATLAQTNEQVEAEPASVPMFDVDEPEPMQWRVADFVPEDHLTMLVADGGTGKSILAVHLSLCIATGRPFFGMNTRRGRVLYIDHELDRDEQLRRMYKVARGMGVDLRSESVRDRLWYLNPVHALGTAEHQNTVLHDVERRSIDLVVLDSLTMGAAGDVADVADVVPIMQDIRQWPTTVAIDHVSHSTARGSAASARAFGSVFKRNAARSSLTLAQADTGGFALQQEKSNFSQGDGRLTYAVEWMDDRIVFERISDADERAAGLLSDLSTREVTLAAVTDMYEATGGAVHPSDVIAWRDEREEGSSQVSKEKTVQNHFTALKKQGKIVTDKHGAALPASAEHQIPTDAPEDDAPF